MMPVTPAAAGPSLLLGALGLDGALPQDEDIITYRQAALVMLVHRDT